jgi:hypothetical protein
MKRKTYAALFIALTVMLFHSCADFGNQTGRLFKGNSGVPSAQPSVGLDASPDAGAAYDTAQNGGYWLCAPRNGSITIVGFSSQLLKDEDEVASALDDAARRVAIFHGVKGKVVSMIDSGSGYLDFSYVTDINLDYGSDYQKYMERIVFDKEKDVTRRPEIIYITAAYPADHGLAGYTTTMIDGKPSWTKKPPLEISGFLAGVGFSKAQRLLKDTITKSHEAAISSIIARVSTQTATQEVDAGGGRALSVTQISEAALVNCLALEIWVDAGTKAVWTLAVAKPR